MRRKKQSAASIADQQRRAAARLAKARRNPSTAPARVKALRAESRRLSQDVKDAQRRQRGAKKVERARSKALARKRVLADRAAVKTARLGMTREERAEDYYDRITRPSSPSYSARQVRSLEAIAKQRLTRDQRIDLARKVHDRNFDMKKWAKAEGFASAVTAQLASNMNW